MNGLRLGRLFGFTVRVDLSWFIVFILVLVTFAVVVFPLIVPGLPDVEYFAMSFVLTVLFFASLVWHEVSHAVLARRKGIAVEGITLFIFGSIAQTRADPDQPGDEFIIAAAGPIASLILALLLFGAYTVTTAIAAPAYVTVVLKYGAVLNVAIALVNLLPGFPLDGGRLLRALIWRSTGDLRRATRITTSVAIVLGAVLVVAGVVLAFQQHVVAGLWTIFVGWFLYNASVDSYHEHELAVILKRGHAQDVMQPPVEHDRHHWPAAGGRATMVRLRGWIVQPQDSLLRVIDGLRASPRGRVLVARDGELLGIITLRDVTAWLERAQAEAD